MSTLRAQVQAVRDTLAQGWTQGTYARDKAGKGCYALLPEACQWCILGAMDRCTQDVGESYALADHIRDAFAVDNLATFNDAPDTTQELVLQKLDAYLETLP